MEEFFVFLTANESALSLFLEFMMVAAGFSAIVIYKLQERDKLRTAATLVLEQIDEIENIVQNFIETYTHSQDKEIDDNAMYLAKEIPLNGAWEQYQHMLLRKLSLKEVALVNEFYESAYRIEKARSDAVYSFKLGWHSKTLSTYLVLMKYNDPTFMLPQNCSTENAARLTQTFKENTKNTSAFRPNITYKLLYAELESYAKLNGTTAYSKLYKLSYRK